MAHLSTSDPAHRDERRRKVEYLKIRGLTIREIVKTMAESGFRNPITGEPYTLNTIALDCQWLRKDWARRHEEEIAVHIARQLAGVREGIRAAWARNDLAEVRQFMKREAELLGLD